MIHNDILAREGFFDITFDWPVFFSQLFGFALIVYAFIKWGAPWVKGIMSKAQDTVAKQIEESSQAADRLIEAKKAYDNALAEATAELERLREDARVDAEHILEKMRQAATDEVARVRRQGRDSVVLFHKQVIRDLEADLLNTIVARTEEKVRDQVSSPRAKADSIERVLGDLESAADSATAPRYHTGSQWN